MESLASLILLILFSILIISFMNKYLRGFGLGFLNPVSILLSYITKPPLKDDGMMNKQDELKLFSRFNSGLLIDVKNKRLSEDESCKHLALISRTGGGKTTSYVLPNIYKLSEEKCSMVITDLSGEIFDKTSGYLEKKGYKIYVLDPNNLDESIRYNPLEFSNTSVEIDTLSEILLASAGLRVTSSEDRIWSDGAKSLISILIKVLKGTEDKKFINLANVRYMINQFGADGKALNEFIKRYADDKTLNEYNGFVSGYDRTLQSFVSNASVALSPIGINDNLEKLTYSNTIDFKKIREEKSVVYIRIKETEQEQYSFLLNLFYTQLFNTMLNKIPAKNDLPIYCLLDEFGNMNIPKFPSIITTIRKYKVSISIILQNISQLNEVYSPNKAKTILDGGIASKLILSGADLDLASSLERMFGKRKKLEETADGNYVYENIDVMSASEIRTMKDNEALFVYANKRPLKMDIKPYYKDFMFNSFSKINPSKQKLQSHDDNIVYVDLNNIDWGE
ncbi:MAG: type IV secretory system conjugative DNA transfer family protein [Halarcobacter sp.]